MKHPLVVRKVQNLVLRIVTQSKATQSLLIMLNKCLLHKLNVACPSTLPYVLRNQAFYSLFLAFMADLRKLLSRFCTSLFCSSCWSFHCDGVPFGMFGVIHRHIPILVRNIGSSYSELLHIISEPPHGSENLLILVLQTLTADCTPAPDLIATVKQLYETKLKVLFIL
ncbi:hypothetical protein EJ110_NYTH23197 [Nymphaea thermarum]|nr:hypothetical protein EJ110_NYTH23197 [Nymphaea thermarum]